MSYLESISYVESNMKETACNLRMLSSNFYATGNTLIGSELLDMARSLTETAEILNNEVHKEIRNTFDLSQKANANMINACLSINPRN